MLFDAVCPTRGTRAPIVPDEVAAIEFVPVGCPGNESVESVQQGGGVERGTRAAEVCDGVVPGCVASAIRSGGSVPLAGIGRSASQRFEREASSSGNERLVSRLFRAEAHVWTPPTLQPV